ncbi:MAG: hypothetical protein PHC69_01180 [Ruminiclostridium sp.]|nr:hypothetical protein [Ruminiclostridium sp.]
MGQEYTMKYNPQSCTWETVRVQAALRLGSKETEEFMLLSPEFKVEDAPNIRAGFRGGIKSGIFKVINKKIIDDGKWAEFYIQLVEPKNSAERRRMAAILQNQMDFPLKVTLNPLSAFLPGVPINVMNAMADRSAETITVFLEAPKDRLRLEPDENPLQIASNAETEVPFIAALEKIDFETMSYVPARDIQGKVVLPKVDTRSATGKEYLVVIKKEEDEKAVRYNIAPRRFIVGDGTPMECTAFYVRCPDSFNHVEPNQVKVMVLCKKYPVEADVRVIRGNKELCRQTVTFSGEQILVDVTSKDSKMDWNGVDLVWQVTSPGRFYAKSHQDWGRMSLAQSQSVNIVLVKGDAPLTKDMLEISIEDSVAEGTLQVSKCGWLMIDSRLEELFPDADESISERLRGAVLEVTCEAAFEPQRGQLKIDLGRIPILDTIGVLTLNGKKIVGESTGEKLVFQPDGERIPGKVATLHLKLFPEDIIRDYLEEIRHRAAMIDETLATAVSAFVKGELSFLAREKYAVLSNALQDIYGKLLATETFFGKIFILQKDLDIAFDLRAKAASQILNDIIGVLVEFASIYIQSKASQGSLLNSDTVGVQKKVNQAYKVEKLAQNRLDLFKKEVEGFDKKIADMQKSLTKANATLEELAEKSSDLIKKTTISASNPNNAKELAETTAAMHTAVKSRNQIFEEITAQQNLKGYMLDNIEKLNKAMVKKGSDLSHALKDLQTEIGVMQTGGNESLEEAAKMLFEQDYEVLTQIHEERMKGRSEPFLRSLYNLFDNRSMPVIEGGLIPKTPSLTDLLIDDSTYNQFIDSMISSLGQVLDTLWELLERIPATLSAFFRDWSWINPVVNEPYRTDYAEYKGRALKIIPTRLPALDQNLITGKFVVDEVKAGHKPIKELIERAKGIWLDEDYKNRNETLSLVKYWARDVLERTITEDRWMDVSPAAFEKASLTSDKLISLIKAYDISFDDNKKWQMTDNPSWQNIENIINEVSFYLSWLLRILSWASMYTGVLAPVALGLSKAGDVIDIGGAMLQAGISITLTLPEINGIVEAVPLLTAMMHDADMTSEVNYDGNILDF